MAARRAARAGMTSVTSLSVARAISSLRSRASGSRLENDDRASGKRKE